MAKGIRLQPIVSQKAADKIKLVAEENGETVSSIVNRLIITQLANPQSSDQKQSATPIAQLRRQEKRILGLLKPLNEKIANATITTFERELWYESVEALAYVRRDLGIEPRHPDAIMLAHYNRESEQLFNQSIEDSELLRSKKTRPEILPEVQRRREECAARSLTVQRIIHMYEKRIKEANNQE